MPTPSSDWPFFCHDHHLHPDPTVRAEALNPGIPFPFQDSSSGSWSAADLQAELRYNHRPLQGSLSAWAPGRQAGAASHENTLGLQQGKV